MGARRLRRELERLLEDARAALGEVVDGALAALERVEDAQLERTARARYDELGRHLVGVHGERRGEQLGDVNDAAERALAPQQVGEYIQ